jgi:hypothetical protein
MAVYKIFPEKDATIYSEYPYKNTGLDEILELNLNPNASPIGTSGSIITEVSRFLIQFPQIEINRIIDNYVSGSWKSYLKLYLADASNIPLDYSLECYPISGSWNMGTGRSNNIPETQNGVCWEFKSFSGSLAWNTGSFGTGVTASFISTSYEYRPGGGTWFTGSNSLNLFSSQSFTYITTKDLEFDISNASLLHYSASKGLGGINNNGFIVKHTNSNEFQANSNIQLGYFSLDTHTIFPPQIELKWNDSIIATGSLPFITDIDPVISIYNNKKEFNQNSVQTFKIYSRDKFPTKVFQTSSIYLSNKYLPTSSYYSIVDLNSRETVIDFDNVYTKLSINSESNYFKIYMNGLEPERYYSILIKTVINDNELILDNDYYFKVKL